MGSSAGNLEHPGSKTKKIEKQISLACSTRSHPGNRQIAVALMPQHCDLGGNIILKRDYLHLFFPPLD